MKNQWRLILGIILVFLIILFAVMNVESVPVNFGFGKVVAPLIVIIILCLLLGAILTILVATVPATRRNKELKQLRQQVAANEEHTRQAIQRVRDEYQAQLVNQASHQQSDEDVTNVPYQD